MKVFRDMSSSQGLYAHCRDKKTGNIEMRFIGSRSTASLRTSGRKDRISRWSRRAFPQDRRVSNMMGNKMM